MRSIKGPSLFGISHTTPVVMDQAVLSLWRLTSSGAVAARDKIDTNSTSRKEVAPDSRS
jgi:hypothetical protein